MQLVAPVVDLQLLMQRLSYSQPFIVTGAASATLEEAMLTRREAESMVVNMLDDGIMIDDDEEEELALILLFGLEYYEHALEVS